jgi:hypothetical protein
MILSIAVCAACAVSIYCCKVGCLRFSETDIHGPCCSDSATESYCYVKCMFIATSAAASSDASLLVVLVAVLMLVANNSDTNRKSSSSSSSGASVDSDTTSSSSSSSSSAEVGSVMTPLTQQQQHRTL